MSSPFPKYAKTEMRRLRQNQRQIQAAPRKQRALVPPIRCETHYAKTRNWMDPPQASYYIFGDFDRVGTLQYWRTCGKGPEHIKAGTRIAYRQDWLDDWLAQKIPTTLTPGFLGA